MVGCPADKWSDYILKKSKSCVWGIWGLVKVTQDENLDIFVELEPSSARVHLHNLQPLKI